MEIQPQLHRDEVFVKDLQNCAEQLSKKLSSDDLEGASELIGQLISARDTQIFQSVGKLTRGLHDAIVNFHVDGDLNSDPPKVDSSEIHDASDRLNYVIQTTQAAADKTMDMVEASAPIAMRLGEEASVLHEEWRRLKRREMNADEFRAVYNRMDSFLGDMCQGTEELNKNLQDIILEQGFQDLTGQVLRRVIGLVRDVETNLVELVRVAGHVEEITGLASTADKETSNKKEGRSIEGEGPQIHAEKRDDVVNNQDDVDDLLSSLGF